MAGTTPTPQNYSSTISEVTTQQYMRGEWNDTKKIRALLERLDMKGKIDETGAGTFAEWKSRVGEYEDGYRTDLAARTFQRKNHRITATLPWAFTEVTDVLSDRDIQLNRGEQAIVKLKEELLTNLGQDFKKGCNRRLLRENAGTTATMGIAAFSDADAPIYGLPTVFNAGSTVYARGTTTPIAATHKYVEAQGLYAGHSIQRGGLTGVDNANDDAWSPYLANIGYDWDGSTNKTWAANCVEVVNDMMTGLAHGDTAEEFPDLGIMTKSMFTEFKSKLMEKQRIILDSAPSSPDAGMYPRFHIPYEGATLVFDADQADDCFYMLNTDKMQYKIVPAGDQGSPSGALGGSAGEIFGVTQQHSIEQGGNLVAVTLASQLCVDPRYQGAAYLWA